MSTTEIALCIGALGLAGLGIIFSIAGGISQAISHVRRRKYEAHTGEIQIIQSTLEQALDDQLYLEPPHRNRHNIHCPKCGRFAKRVLDHDDITDCKVHGVQVRWREMPVDWALFPVTQGVTMVMDTPFIDELFAPSTGPLPIIIPDDLSDLIALGARI